MDGISLVLSPLFSRSQEEDANELGLDPDKAISDSSFTLSTTDIISLLLAKQQG
jgi:hypothetical protein